jgi:hypothetical protein
MKSFRILLAAPLLWLAASSVAAAAAEHYALQWATYLGGSDYEHARDVCTDAQGNVYVVGGTRSTNFPIVGGTPFHRGPRTDPNGNELKDAFVAKFSPAGQLLWSTCLGGPNYERAYAVEVDSHGNIFVAGRAGKEFPVTAGAFQTTFHGSDMRAYGGWQNGFVAKFGPDGALLWTSYVGTVEMCRDLAVDANGDVYVPMGYANRGAARQSATEPPWMAAALTNAFQKTRNAGQECGVVKIKGDGSAVLWATWLGGSGNDSQEASIRLDKDNYVFVLPYSFSVDAPITAGARLYIRLIHEQFAPDPHRPLLVNIGGHFALPNKSR